MENHDKWASGLTLDQLSTFLSSVETGGPHATAAVAELSARAKDMQHQEPSDTPEPAPDHAPGVVLASSECLRFISNGDCAEATRAAFDKIIAHHINKMLSQEREEERERCCDAVRSRCKACNGDGCIPDDHGEAEECQYCGYPIDAIKAYADETTSGPAAERTDDA